MSEIVFILGAGASADAGAPVMADFLDRAEEALPGDRNVMTVLRAAGNLQQVLAKAYFDVHNIESIFGAIEMGRLIQKFPGFADDELDALSLAINQLIAATLRVTVAFPIQGGKINPTTSYKQFADLVESLNKHRERATIITLNYDIALDYALQFIGRPADYCLAPPTPSRRTKLLKLHGSLNWGRCNACGKILTADQFFKNTILFDDDEKQMILDLEQRLKELSCCKGRLDPRPVLVPPTWNKTQDHYHVKNVWRQAALELSDAREIFICGYSLPDTDSFFSYLFALGSVGTARLRTVTVFDPNKEVEGRFKKLLGSTIRLDYRQHKFREAIGFMRQELA